MLCAVDRLGARGSSQQRCEQVCGSVKFNNELIRFIGSIRCQTNISYSCMKLLLQGAAAAAAAPCSSKQKQVHQKLIQLNSPAASAAIAAAANFSCISAV